MSMPVLLLFTRRFSNALCKTVRFERLFHQAWLVLGWTFFVVLFEVCLQPHFPMVALPITVSNASSVVVEDRLSLLRHKSAANAFCKGWRLEGHGRINVEDSAAGGGCNIVGR